MPAHMLETIALIASGVSALSSVTTSLRALGRSREGSDPHEQGPPGEIVQYLLSTLIWFVLSVVCVIPYTLRIVENSQYWELSIMALIFFGLIGLLAVIWNRVLSFRRNV